MILSADFTFREDKQSTAWARMVAGARVPSLPHTGKPVMTHFRVFVLFLLEDCRVLLSSPPTVRLPTYGMGPDLTRS